MFKTKAYSVFKDKLIPNTLKQVAQYYLYQEATKVFKVKKLVVDDVYFQQGEQDISDCFSSAKDFLLGSKNFKKSFLSNTSRLKNLQNSCMTGS